MMKRPLFSFSIADIPFNISLKTLFAFAKKSGFDGVEVLPGFKTLQTVKTLSLLSKEYELPILSLHHPFWIAEYIIDSDMVFEAARIFDAVIVVHPKKRYPLTSSEQRRFLSSIHKKAKKHNVFVTLENVSRESTLPLYRHFSKTEKSITLLTNLVHTCDTYGFGMTLDTSHLGSPFPQTVDGFDNAFILIKNIHLSDYTDTKQHLALGIGNLKVEDFCDYLKRKKYTGIITLEFSPRLFYDQKTYLHELISSLHLLKRQFR